MIESFRFEDLGFSREKKRYSVGFGELEGSGKKIKIFRWVWRVRG
jgi:hypothetical protein